MTPQDYNCGSISSICHKAEATISSDEQSTVS